MPCGAVAIALLSPAVQSATARGVIGGALEPTFGHDVAREGYEMTGDEQICVSTSYGLFDRDKVYLRLDLSHRYRSVKDLREGREICPLYPDAA